VTVGWQRDERDSILAPTTGKMQRVNLELSPAGDTRFARANLQYQQYFPLIARFSWGLNAELGWGIGMGGRPYPVFKNFQGGGLGSVRVFQPGTLGPVDITNSYIGGNRRVNMNAELYVPVPGAGNDKSFRLFGFFDAGNVWAEHEKLSASDLRTSVGVGISWISPMGPLKLSWGTPLRKKPTDRIEKLQFQIGTAF
jgi:outer membrane protein insertion porin family